MSDAGTTDAVCVGNRPGNRQQKQLFCQQQFHRLIIEGTGRQGSGVLRRPAGGLSSGIDYFDTPPVYDCPSLSAYFGDACDDGDNTTINDTVDNDCNCAGTPTTAPESAIVMATAFVYRRRLHDDSDPSVSTQPGDVCDDGDPATINDMLMPIVTAPGPLTLHQYRRQRRRRHLRRCGLQRQ